MGAWPRAPPRHPPLFLLPPSSPVRRRQPRRRRQPALPPAAVKQDVKPGGYAVHVAVSRDDEAERDGDAAEVGRGHRPEIDHPRLRPAHQAVRVHGVDDDLLKVGVRGGRFQGRQVDAVKIWLPPKGGLGLELGVQGGVGKGGDMDAAQGLEMGAGGGGVGGAHAPVRGPHRRPRPSHREHAPARLQQVIPRVHIALQHALVEEQGAHGLGHKDVGAREREARRLDARAHDGHATPRPGVGGAERGRVVGHGGRFHRVHAGGAGLGGKEGGMPDPAPTSTTVARQSRPRSPEWRPSRCRCGHSLAACFVGVGACHSLGRGGREGRRWARAKNRPSAAPRRS